MEVLTSRLLLTPTDAVETRRFYGEVLGLAVAREFGPPEHPGIVYFTGGGFLEVSGQAEARPAEAPPATGIRLWLQVRDVHAEHERLVAAGAKVTRAPQLEFWGLIEMWLEDPDGIPIALVEIPPDHPIRRDTR